MSKPRIAVTLGDPAGIGPEIVFKAANSLAVQRVCRPVIFGEAHRCLLPCSHFDFVAASKPGKISQGKPSRNSGIASCKAIEESVKFCLEGKAQGLVTAPVSKESFKLAGVKFIGHTELLAALTKSERTAMLMACGKIHSVMVTRHIPLAKVSKSLTIDKIIDAVNIAADFLGKSGDVRRLKVALCALNPHAGDNAILGKEEKDVIFPAYKILRKTMDISKPLAADAAWLKTKNGEYDLICCMYHDQTMIPLKCIDAQKIVNVTAGLPFIRTSPGHGTAFDIAGKNKADPSAMIEAILYAAKKAKNAALQTKA
ncbi:MAG: 4-hydroxythreonine-4-phosphate dehydrogenase PdxA [Endomicrobium sp.]|jgi:4-hydroxythreonine-4-phosphate dehydrogenase|nr:4-hydroxythreonine-4-phosphate dehydrogenase PdxA [Endomicrobium sp.]